MLNDCNELRLEKLSNWRRNHLGQHSEYDQWDSYQTSAEEEQQFRTTRVWKEAFDDILNQMPWQSQGIPDQFQGQCPVPFQFHEKT